jgi:peptidoglycan/LPS O-acetylase OafA/YrhL
MDTRENANLDFLRSFAVLCVVFGHLTHFFNVDQAGLIPLGGLGALGVRIFFVHTALVLMFSLERDAAKFKILFIPFMVRRCFRIYPLAMAVILIISGFHIPQAALSAGYFTGWKFDGGDLLANLFLVQNLSFRVPILGPIWSLSYELEMYLFLPLIFLILRNVRSLWRFAGFIALLLACSFEVAQRSTTPNVASYVPCFLAGIVAYQLRRYDSYKLPASIWPVFVIGIGLAYLSSSLTRIDTLCACFLLGLAIPAFTTLTSRWITIASKLIAKYSYGIYLTHFFAIWFAFEKLSAAPFLSRILVFLTLASTLPVLFYHSIEEPMVRAGKKVAQLYIASRQSRSSGQKSGLSTHSVPVANPVPDPAQ